MSRPLLLPSTVALVLAAAWMSACSSRVEGTEPGDCTDGADNDGDGLFDCRDPSCAGSPLCAPDSGLLDAGNDPLLDASHLRDGDVDAANLDAGPDGEARDAGASACGDTTLDPDEQCEDGNTTDGDGCSSTCRTEAFVVSTTAGGQDSPTVAGAPAQRWSFAYTNTADRKTLVRLLEPSGATIVSPSALMNDAVLDTIVGGLSGSYLFSDTAVASGGRIGTSVTQFFSGAAHVRVAFMDQNRTPEADSILVRGSLPTALEPESSVAFAGNGAFMIVFEDSTSTTGLSGQIFAAESTTPIAPDPFVVGSGATLASDPRLAGASDHFVVAFAAGGDVFVQRFGTDGTPRDASGIAVLEDAAGMQSEPAVAALGDGRALVAWRDSVGDGAGTAIRARAFGATGAPAGATSLLNTTTAGDQMRPSISGAGELFLAVFQSGSSVRARVISPSGAPFPNRERPPTTDDFEVSSSGTSPAVSAGGLDGEAFMVTWADGGDIHARVFTFPMP